MSLISKDFRLNQHRLDLRQEQQHSHKRLGWMLFALACAVIGGVIANTTIDPSADSTSIAIKSLPTGDLTESSNILSSEGSSSTTESSATSSDTISSEKWARESFTLSLPELQAKQNIVDEANSLSPKEWRDFTVKSGDNLARLFQRAKIKPQQLDELMKSGDDVKTLKRIFPKDTLRILSDDEGILQALRYDIDEKSYLMVQREQVALDEHGALVAQIYQHHITTRKAHASGVIDSSLFLAAQKAGISQNIIMELANVFGWDIDFVLDIRKGDSFTVLYEELYRDGEKISDGKILAADFVNNGKIYRAVRYTNPQTNDSEYYTPDGKSMRKAFLRTPVNFARISSRFTTSRYHPVLHKFRSHKGVDYAAKRGTPIYAAGDGKIIFKGKKGGYGNVLILQHGSKYTTLYAHLKTYNRKLRNGSRVKQGQTIAYVGSSGLATGPHLHYEFRVNGVHRNPLTVKLPISNPVPKRYLTDFDLMTSPLIAQLDLVTRPQQFALTE